MGRWWLWIEMEISDASGSCNVSLTIVLLNFPRILSQRRKTKEENDETILHKRWASNCERINNQLRCMERTKEHSALSASPSLLGRLGRGISCSFVLQLKRDAMSKHFSEQREPIWIVEKTKGRRLSSSPRVFNQPTLLSGLHYERSRRTV